ncbi:Enduracididine beta-hydroxylase (plasmid) [Streptomyces sp. enrichment culture]|uniref:guanitoxin biosynthesis L-enduracididine beta-hydroxylase GntD n=1 Tax=Streptomyces sp. enrichment culture TaxID=1795815 RepID=UPI003F54583A
MQGSSLSSEVDQLGLSREEITEIDNLVDPLLVNFPDASGTEFMRAVALLSHALPERLRAFLLDMRTRESAAACVISGFDVDDKAIGPTPAGWTGQPDPRTTKAEEVRLLLCGAVLGEPFGWATQQAGALIHDIAPSRADEHKQVGSSSSELLWWHTEEAFHPLRCDYLGLLCLRNHDLVPTTFASIGNVRLDADVRKVLFQERFVIRPDDSHLPGHGDVDGMDDEEEGELLVSARDQIRQMNDAPRMVPLLSGDFDSPYMTIDPFYMSVPDEDREAQEAYARLRDALDGCIEEITLRPGEILIIDNYRAVHGRNPFRPRYDGTDRWLKRINITRDLRKSRAYRTSSEARIVH